MKLTLVENTIRIIITALYKFQTPLKHIPRNTRFSFDNYKICNDMHYFQNIHDEKKQHRFL